MRLWIVPPLIVLLVLLTGMSAAQVVCPYCKEKGIKSKVYPRGCMSTLLACSTYYDEEGNYHSEPCNTCTCDYSCTENHHWSDKQKC